MTRDHLRPTRPFLVAALAAATLLPAPRAARAEILNVPEDFETIQEAIDAAERFDEIVVAPGTYEERQVDFLGKEITVRSTDPDDPAVVAATIVDATGQRRAFVFQSGETRNSVLAGLTLTGGDAHEGGGVKIEDASPTIDRCVIEGNIARSGGGGVVCRGPDSEPLITGATIRDNQAIEEESGGGAPEGLSPALAELLARRERAGAPWRGPLVRTTAGGLKAVECSPEIVDSTISGNFAGQGGGLGFKDSAAVIRRTTVSGNEAVWGGGIHFREAPEATLEDSVVEGNVADFGAGGIGIEQSQITIARSEIRGNTAVSFGGGIAISRAAPRLTSSLIVDNVVNEDGGGVAVLNTTAPELVNTTFSGNQAGRGGALFLAEETGATVLDSILWGDTPDEIFVLDGTADVTWSDVEGGWPGEGNIDADPLFVNPPDDYRLQEGSPAIDVALAEGAAGDDLDGEIRPWGTEFDMGADEYYGPPTVHDVPADFATLQEAIDAAFNGDEIVLTEGTHVEHDIEFSGKAVTVRGADPDDPAVVAATVVDGGGLGSVFRFVDGETDRSVLAGLTVTGGASPDGGGIFVDGASPTIDRAVVSGNQATAGNGGGVFSRDGSPLILASTLSGNSAIDCVDPLVQCGSGGGLFAVGGSPRVEGSTVTGNSAQDQGGGLYVDGGELVGGVVSGNDAEQGGGVFSLRLRAEGAVVGPANSAALDGGGLWVESGSLLAVTVESNVAETGGGAALSDSVVRESTFRGNEASDNGGGVSSQGSEIVYSTLDANTAARGGGAALATSLLRDATVTGNHATLEGGGAWLGEIRDSHFEGNTSDADGGGISGASRVEACVVVGNEAAARGGGLANPQIVRETEIRDNRAETGGGLYVENEQADEALVRSCLVTGNSATFGAGIAVRSTWPPPSFSDPVPVKIVDTEVSANEADQNGGAVHCEECVARVLRTVVRDNVANFQGGAFWVTPTTTVDAQPDFEVEGSWVSFNTAVENGGAMYCGVDGVVDVFNTQIWGNSAVDGGAFYSDSCKLEIVNSTVTQNVASGAGGALLTTSSFTPDVKPQVRNTIFWNDTPDEIVILSLGSPEVSFSDVQGGWPGDGNLDADPLFVDPDPAVADFHLTVTSPLIDAGSDELVPDIDIDGEDRPEGDGVDVGADELVLEDDAAKTPAIATIEPDRGLAVGGESVVITGERFGTYSRVFFGGGEATVVAVAEESLEVLTPSFSSDGFVDVEVTNFGEFDAVVEDGFEVLLPPFPVPESVEPPTGLVDGGEEVTVFGSGFSDGMSVYFGLERAPQVTFVSATELTVVTPEASATGTVDVVVRDIYGQTGVLADGFTYVPAPPPQVDSVDPASGPVSGGTPVSVFGDDFSDGVELFFGASQATDVVLVSPQQLQATTPASTVVGLVDVVVRDTFGQEGVLPSGFEYVAEDELVIFELDPPAGSTGGGERVTIRGQGFADPMELTVAGRPVEVSFLDPATLDFVTPSHPAGPECTDQVVDVELERADGATASATFTYQPAQVIEVLPGESIQERIDAAARGACILLAANPYPGYVENLVIRDEPISIYGDPADPTGAVINGSGGAGAVVQFTSSPEAGTLLSGVSIVLGDGGIEVTDAMPTLENLVIQNNETSGDGGGLAVYGGGEPTLRDSVVTQNVADEGGGIWVGTGAGLELEETLVSLNEARAGGGVWLGGDVVVGWSGNTIELNEATTGSGGGFWAEPGAEVELTGIEIASNVAGDDGGGLAIGADGVLTLTDALVSGNTAGGDGGGLWADDRGLIALVGGEVTANLAGFTVVTGSTGTGGGIWVGDDAEVAIQDLLVEANAALAEIGGGGGVRLGGFATGSLTGCRIVDNQAQVGGGISIGSESAVLLERNEVACNRAVQNADLDDPEPPASFAPGIYLVSAQGNLYNNTVFANTGGDGVTESGGVHHEGPFLFPEVVNNLFAGNDGWGLYCTPGSLLGRLDYNLYHGNGAGDVANCVAGSNAVFADPLLVAPVCPDPDLELQPGSPAIDAGDPSFDVPPGGGSVVDIGANELGG